MQHPAYNSHELNRLIIMAAALGYPTDWVDKRMQQAVEGGIEYEEKFKERYFQNILQGFLHAKKRKSRREILKRLRRMGYTIAYERNGFWEKLTRSHKKPRIEKSEDVVGEQFKLALDNLYAKFSKAAIIKKREKDVTAACIARLKRRVEKVCGHEAYIRKLDRAREALDCCTEDGVYNVAKQACVHATFYHPEQDKDKCYVFENLSSSTGLIDARNTLHTTIGAHVGSHGEGGWDEAPFVLITPLKDMIDKNGKPWGMSLVDTFFEMGLNEDLHLPKDTHLIKPAPGKLPDGVDFITYGNLTLYRTSDFSKESRERARKPYEKEEGTVLSDVEMAVRTKFETVAKVLEHKGFMLFSCLPDTVEAENIERLANKLNVRGIAGATLHADWSLFGGNNWYGERMTSLNGILRELEWNVENKYGVKVSEMLPPIRRGTRTSKYESLDKKDSPMEQMKKQVNLSDDIEAMRWEQISEMSTPSVRDYIEHRSQQDENWIAENPEYRQWDEEWHKPRLKALMKQASKKEKEVYEAWVDRTQKRVDILKKVKKQIDAKKPVKKTSGVDR